jgi:hypothetical protein
LVGVNVNAPVDGLKVIPETSPVAERITAPPVPVGSLPEIMKCRLPPTVAFSAAGTVSTGRTFAGSTVMMTYVWAVETPSLAVKLTVYVPGASLVVGVQVNVPLSGDVPWTVEKMASDGTPLAESVKVGVGTDESVAVTVNVRVDVWTMVSVEGAVSTGETCVPTVTVIVAVLVKEPLVPVTTTVKDPAAVGVIVTVEVPEPLILEAPSVAVTPVGLVMLNETLELNPFRRFKLMVAVPWAPVLVERLDGFAERLKSSKSNVIEVV